MDNRLQRRRGQRLQRLRADDLERLARALVQVIRKRGTARVGGGRNLPYIELSTDEGVIRVLKEDWVRMAHLVRDGTLSRLFEHSDPNVGLMSRSSNSVGLVLWINAGTAAKGEVSTSRGDERFYERVLTALRQIFVESYPVS